MAKEEVEEMAPIAIVDYVLEKLALPKLGPVLRSLAPKTVIKKQN